MRQGLLLVHTVAALSLILQIKGITITKNPSPSINGKQSAIPPNSGPQFHPRCVPIRCSDEEEYCECPEHETVGCMFELEVKELQTFTSYKYKTEHREEFDILRIKTKGTMQGTAGDTYYLNGRGFTPSLPPPPPEDSKPPEYGDCYINNQMQILNSSSFMTKGCSTPITVDGSTYRMIIAINGRIPGPTLIVYENQIVQIRVFNKLTSEGITIHWHGMHQQYTPWMDGVGFITQPPIIPGAYFDYIFKAFPSRTHWYHSHVGAQRTDGLFGALIVKEVKHPLNKMVNLPRGTDLVDVPEKYTITLLDWERESSLNLFVRIHSTLGFFPDQSVGEVPTQENNLYIRTRSSDGIEVGPVPYWSGLMNGKGRHNDDTFSILSIFEVDYKKSYRFRLIGAQSLYAFKFSIDGHKLLLIATDGQFIEQKEVDYIIIHSGERYDFILTADKQPGNYWMRAETLESINVNKKHSAEGILHYTSYDKAPNPFNKYRNVPRRERVCSRRKQCKAVNCPFKEFPSSMNTRCIHLDELNAKISEENPPRILHDQDDKNLKFFNFGFEGQSSTSAINGKNFLFPTTPYQTYCDQYDIDARNDDLVCKNIKTNPNMQECINVAQIAESDTFDPNAAEHPSVNFVLSSVGDLIHGNNDFTHPIHLHGHTFFVVAIRHGKYDKGNGTLIKNNQDVVCDDLEQCPSPHWRKGPPFNKNQKRVRKQAIRKDTIIVPAGGYVVIAFEANNPGYWFMHCHIESHQLEGMAVIIQEYPSSQQWAPPGDINRVGNFKWNRSEYITTVSAHKQCGIRL